MHSIRDNFTFIFWIRSVYLKKDKYHNFNSARGVCLGCYRGKVVAPYRMIHPWLLLDWIYRLTKTAKLELQQQEHIIHFTRKVSKTTFLISNFRRVLNVVCFLLSNSSSQTFSLIHTPTFLKPSHSTPTCL